MPVSGNEVLQQVAKEDMSLGTGLDADGKTKVNASHIVFSSDPSKKVDQFLSGTAIKGQCADPSLALEMVNLQTLEAKIAAGVAGSILGNSEGLVVSRTNVTTVSVDFSRVQVTNSGGAGVILPAPATPYSAVITTSGAGGLDTGAEAVSSWYYIYMIFDESGTNATNAILSLSATTPTMPSGYTHKTLLSAVYNNSAGDFEGFHQLDKDYAYDVARVLSATSLAGNGSSDLTNFIPDVMFKGVRGKFGVGGVAGVELGLHHVSTVTVSDAVYYYISDPNAINVSAFSNFTLDVLVTRTLYYVGASLTGTVYVSGFTIRS